MSTDNQDDQDILLETDAARSLLDQLLIDSKLYTQSKDYKELLEFSIRMRNVAPFNAMLLQVQKPGLKFAASAHDWRVRFGVKVNEGARPLLILWPFGPVALVYDVADTDCKNLPQDVMSYYAHGSINEKKIASFIEMIGNKCIECHKIDTGDQNAGSIRVMHRALEEKEYSIYRMKINRNHVPAIQFTTIAHELGHLFLGHLGPDKKLNIPKRTTLTHKQVELEAESVAYLVCARNGVQSKSETYLTNYVDHNTTIGNLDLYQVMRSAGQVEAILGLTAHMKYDRPQDGK